MARRHEDREPGKRFERGPGGGKKGGKGPSKSGPSRSGPSKSGPSKSGPSKSGPSKSGPSRSGPARPSGPRKPPSRSGGSRAPSGGAGKGRGPARGVGSKRRAAGVVVTPAILSGEKAGDGKVRLNHFLAMCGVCSRRAADGLIAGGRVEVNGEHVRELGVRIDPGQDDVRLDGTRLQAERPVYVLFNKPKGVVCTNASNEQKKRVIDFLPQVRGRLFTVGRLDLESEGLILLTNDGAFAQEMMHPRYGVPKVYSVMVRGRVEEAKIDKARSGVWLSEGPTAGMHIKIERLGKDRTFLKVTLREGKNREIRRVFAKLGYTVTTLKRIRIGDLNLHGLREAAWRFVQLHEIEQLRQTAREELEPR